MCYRWLYLAYKLKKDVRYTRGNVFYTNYTIICMRVRANDLIVVQ